MKRISLNIEVPFFDVDTYRVVWHGNYPKYLEMSRCKLLETMGCSYSVMEQEGYFFPIVDIHIKYIKPLLFQQNIVVECWPIEWENRLKIDYVIKDKETNEMLCKAKTCQFAVSMPDKITQYQSPSFLIEAVENWVHA